MRPQTAFDGDANSRAHDRRARKRPRHATLRSLLSSALARLQSLFTARHATDSSLDDALGEQVTLPDAYPKPASHESKATKAPAGHKRFNENPDLGKRN